MARVGVARHRSRDLPDRFRLQSVIGYTRRADDGSLAICGMAVLRAQEDGQDLKSTHAYRAHREAGNVYALHDSADFASRLRSSFAFAGYDGEHQSGLGLAILYPHLELKPDGILAAAIENFAPAIMNGTLVLGVGGRILDALTIKDVALGVAGHLNDEAIKADVIRYLDLVRRAQTEPRPHKIRLPIALKTDLEALRSTPAILALQKKIVAEEDVVLEIIFPLTRNNVVQDVSLRVAVGTSPSGHKPIDRLFREGMSLPDVNKAKSLGELDLVMLVEDGELATYLNFCEGKAHLDLLESKDVLQKLEQQGFDGLRVKHLVKHLSSEIRLLLSPEVTAPDANVFDSYFSKPSDMPGKKKKPNKPDEPPPPPPPPKPPVLRVETLDDGLRITGSPGFNDWPINVSITIFYADGSRRPSWSEFDFKIEDLQIDSADCKLATDKNRVNALDCGPAMMIKITGFDKNRELDTTIRLGKNA